MFVLQKPDTECESKLFPSFCSTKQCNKQTPLKTYSGAQTDTHQLHGVVLERVEPMRCSKIAVCTLGIQVAHLCQMYELADLGPSNTVQRMPPNEPAVPQILLLDAGSWVCHTQNPRWPRKTWASGFLQLLNTQNPNRQTPDPKLVFARASSPRSPQCVVDKGFQVCPENQFRV